MAGQLFAELLGFPATRRTDTEDGIVVIIR